MTYLQHSSSQSGAVDTKLSENAPQSPATDSVERQCASQISSTNSTSTPPVEASASPVDQLSDKHTVTQEISSASPNAESTPNAIKCSSTCNAKSAEAPAQSETSTTSCQPESKAAHESVKHDPSKPVR